MNHEQFRQFVEHNCQFDKQTLAKFEIGFERDYSRFNQSKCPKEINVNTEKFFI